MKKEEFTCTVFWRAKQKNGSVSKTLKGAFDVMVYASVNYRFSPAWKKWYTILLHPIQFHSSSQGYWIYLAIWVSKLVSSCLVVGHVCKFLISAVTENNLKCFHVFKWSVSATHSLIAFFKCTKWLFPCKPSWSWQGGLTQTEDNSFQTLSKFGG